MEFLTRLEVLQRQNDLLANQLSQTVSDAQELPMEMAHLMDEKDSLRERAMVQGDKMDELVRQLDSAQGLIARLNR